MADEEESEDDERGLGDKLSQGALVIAEDSANWLSGVVAKLVTGAEWVAEKWDDVPEARQDAISAGARWSLMALVVIFVVWFVAFLFTPSKEDRAEKAQHEAKTGELAQKAKTVQVKPANVKALLERDGQFTTFLALCDIAELNGLLTTSDPMTVLAPTDRAFSLVDEGKLEARFASKETLKTFLGDYFVKARVDVLGAKSVTAISGKVLTVQRIGEKVRVQDADVGVYRHEGRLEVTDDMATYRFAFAPQTETNLVYPLTSLLASDQR